MSIKKYIPKGIIALGLATTLGSCGGCTYFQFGRENHIPQAAQEARLLNIRRQIIQDEMRNGPISTAAYFVEDREKMETILRTEANKRHKEAGKVELAELETRIQAYESNPEVVAYIAKGDQNLFTSLKCAGGVLAGLALLAAGVKWKNAQKD